MIALYTTDVNGLYVDINEFDNLVDALMAFELSKHDYTIGHIELWDEESRDDPVRLNEHTTLWALN